MAPTDPVKTDKLKTEPVKKINGGARPGSGRKPKANFEARELFKMAFDEAFTLEDWKKLIQDAKTDSADRRYIIDQRIGKATQSMEHSGPDGTALGFVILPAKQ